MKTQYVLKAGEEYYYGATFMRNGKRQPQVTRMVERAHKYDSFLWAKKCADRLADLYGIWFEPVRVEESGVCG